MRGSVDQACFNYSVVDFVFVVVSGVTFVALVSFSAAVAKVVIGLQGGLVQMS